MILFLDFEGVLHTNRVISVGGHPRFAGTLLNAAFVSDLTPLIEKADLWIHGHVHDSFDYEIGDTRVIANPRG